MNSNSILDGLRSATQKDVALAAKVVSTAHDKIESIEKLINDQNEIITSVIAGTPDGSLIQSQREDLLAGIASGEKSRDDLDTFEKQVTVIEDSVAEAREQSRHAKAAIAGLERKRTAALEALEVAKDEYKDVCKHFIAGLYKKTMKSYERHAAAIEKDYQKLVGFDHFMTQAGLRGSTIAQSIKMKIPKFRYMDDWANNRKACLFDPYMIDRSVFEDMVRKELQASGVEV